MTADERARGLGEGARHDGCSERVGERVKGVFTIEGHAGGPPERAEDERPELKGSNPAVRSGKSWGETFGTSI